MGRSKTKRPREKTSSLFWDACRFFPPVHRGQITSVCGKTAVIGDGNSAFDAARTLARLGAEVTLISWFPEELIPAEAREVEESVKEGIAIKTGLKVAEFMGSGGRLEAIRLAPTVPGPPDANGICWPITVKGAGPSRSISNEPS